MIEKFEEYTWLCHGEDLGVRSDYEEISYRQIYEFWKFNAKPYQVMKDGQYNNFHGWNLLLRMSMSKYTDEESNLFRSLNCDIVTTRYVVGWKNFQDSQLHE